MTDDITAAGYWEAQADMWHQNYGDACKLIDELKAALQPFAESNIIHLTCNEGDTHISVIRVTDEMMDGANKAAGLDYREKIHRAEIRAAQQTVRLYAVGEGK